MNDTAQITQHFNSFPWDKLFPDLLWIAFWMTLLWFTKDFIKNAFIALISRLKHGAGVKIGSFELEGLKVTAGKEFENNHFQTRVDESNERDKERAEFYTAQRGAMLVHKIFKSQKDGHLYDILIYLVPKKNCTLIQVTGVDYYFGKHWGRKIFSTTDRSNGFAIATSAYGPFLCTAKINFNDGQSETVYRYIDFEMGSCAPIINNEV